MIQIRIAYFLLRFPSITETFIAEEIQKIQATGMEVCIYSLLKPKEKMIQPVSLSLLSLVHYAPGLVHPGIWFAQIHFFIKSPNRYYRSFITLLKLPAPNSSFRVKRFLIFLKSIWVAHEIEKRPPQLIHAHFAWLSAASGWIVSQLLDIPFTVTTHAFDIFSQKNDLLAFTTCQAARVITISENNKLAMLAMVDGPVQDKIHVVHCGIDLQYFHKETETDETPNELIQITSVGSLITKKGHEYLIRACHLLKQIGLDFNCVIIGSGPLRGSLQALIDELALNDHLSLAGTQSQDWVKERLAHSDVFTLACILASDGERDGIPVAMMEALAMGVPVISTRVSGIPELIKHEETGLLVPERDPESIALAICRLVQDAELRKRLVVNGRDLVEKEYDITANVQRLRQIFSDVVAEQGIEKVR